MVQPRRTTRGRWRRQRLDIEIIHRRRHPAKAEAPAAAIAQPAYVRGARQAGIGRPRGVGLIAQRDTLLFARFLAAAHHDRPVGPLDRTAPLGLDATGNPIFSRMWSLLGVPCVHVPTGVGRHGMPVGVTVIGPRWRDVQALSAALALEAAVKG